MDKYVWWMLGYGTEDATAKQEPRPPPPPPLEPKRCIVDLTRPAPNVTSSMVQRQRQRLRPVIPFEPIPVYPDMAPTLYSQMVEAINARRKKIE